MNADRLLALFERISEAPDAISRLRRFILDLAVRGKLVEQDPEDEPAEVLLKRLTDAKQALVDSKLIKRPKPWMPIAERETPIPLPKNWAWSRLFDIGRLAGGMTPSMSCPDYWDGDIPWLSPKDIKADEVDKSEMKITAAGLEETRLELYPPGSLFIVARSGILKRTLPVAINRVPAAANQDLKVLVPYLRGSERYLQIMLRGLADFLLKELVKTGTTVQSLKYAEFEQQPFPLPPLAEQHRIVAKVDELMALCDQLEAARVQREQCRERLVAASLQRLNQPSDDPEAFRSDARFALQVLPNLTSTPAQIKQLRQTILNLAVRGKLVEQDPEDGPAEELLRNILIDSELNSGERKARSSSAALSADPHFASPKTWAWTSLGVIGDWGSGSTPPRGQLDFYGGDVSWFKSGELNDNKRLAGSEESVTSLALEKCSFRLNKPGDVLVAMYGATIGKLAILAEPAVTNQAVCACTPSWGVDKDYLYLFLLASREMFKQSSEGGAQPNISKIKILQTPFPLPPLAEQHRIVAKVEELMALFDQLERQLSQVEQSRRGLLEAVLREALLEPEGMPTAAARASAP